MESGFNIDEVVNSGKITDNIHKQSTFIGRYYHALEQKGRLSIPVSFRELMVDGAVLTLGLDGCLFLYPHSEWAKTVLRLNELPFTQKNARDWIRLQANNATEVNFDSLGRIAIPDYLREQSHLTKNLVIVGSFNLVEIWARDPYHNYLSDLERRAEVIAEALPITPKNL